MNITQARGKLVIIGGGEDRKGDCIILKKFIHLAKGPNARILALTVATDEVEKNAAELRRVFRKLGIDDVKVMDVSQRDRTSSESILKAVRQATGIFFSGGDQLHITSLLGGTLLQKAINAVYEKGIVIAGTSAGAAMMGNSMILDGDSEKNPRSGGVEMGPGMDFIVGAMIDTHFSQRGRHGRLITAVAHYPQDLGFGIDEDTAMVVNKNKFEVIGSGAVTVFDGGAMNFTNIPYAEKDAGLALYGLQVHILPEGYEFDLINRKPFVVKDTPNHNARSENKSITVKIAKKKNN